MKTCSVCQIEKPLEEFVKATKRKGGYTNKCIPCNREYYHQWYASHVEHLQKYKESRKDILVQYRKDRAPITRQYDKERSTKIEVRYVKLFQVGRRRELEVDLTLEQFANIVKEPCYYCQNKLGTPSVTGSGMDRMDNDKGYVFGNCVSCCGFCNKIKQDLLTAEETKAAVQAIINVRRQNENQQREDSTYQNNEG